MTYRLYFWLCILSVLYGFVQASSLASGSKMKLQEYQQLSEQQIDDAYRLLSLEPKRAHALKEIEGSFRQKSLDEGLQVFGPKPLPGSSKRNVYTPLQEADLAVKMQNLNNALFIVKTNQQDRKFWGGLGQEIIKKSDISFDQKRSTNLDQLENVERGSVGDVKAQKLKWLLELEMPDDIVLEKTIGRQSPQKFQVALQGETVRSALSKFHERNIFEPNYPDSIEKIFEVLRKSWEKNKQQELIKYFLTDPQIDALDIVPGIEEGLYYNYDDSIEKKLERFLKVRLLSNFCVVSASRTTLVCAYRGETVRDALQFLHFVRADDNAYSDFFNFLFAQFENSAHGTFYSKLGTSEPIFEKRQQYYFFPKKYKGDVNDFAIDWKGYIHKDLLKQIADKMK